MLPTLHTIKSYVLYLIKARNQNSIHSPFVFDLYTNIIRDTTPFYVFDKIEQLRETLLESKEIIQVTDMGAGSHQALLKTKDRRLSNLVRFSSVSPQYGQLLFRLVNFFQPSVILELGTSIGFSTLYLATASKKSKVITIEGCPNSVGLAERNFEKLCCRNIKIQIGNFDEILGSELEKVTPDLVFFDGNHREKPTLNYFEQCLAKANNETVFIFDDIHWSQEMENAWKFIISYPRVTTTIDLFKAGIVFFRKELQKQDYILRF